MAVTAGEEIGGARARPASGHPGAKALGAFYTGSAIADFLVWWAIRSPCDTVLDPSFGGGVFLHAACRRLHELGGQPATQVFGAEIDSGAHARSADELAGAFGVARQHLLLSDFFALSDVAVQQVDAVVGNPPFIRYQRFSGDARKRALRRAASQGVRLTELASSWAPFLVHSIAMLKQGGRLAMVVPMEIAHAAYALPVLRHLVASFGNVTFLTFEKRLFPDLSEDTLLLLAEEKGSPAAEFRLRDFADAGALVDLQWCNQLPLPGTQRLDADALSRGRERLLIYLLPRKVREIYQELQSLPLARRLGDVADVGIGYVTGANDFFHLHPHEAQLWDIPQRFLRPAVRRGRALTGLRFTTADWQTALAGGEAGYLLYVDTAEDLPGGIRRYLANGEVQGIAKSYKCRTRSPWFRVPHVHQPDAFLSYMSGITPRLVANDAGAVAPNSLHVLRLHPHSALAGDGLAALWQTSLTRLSAEIEGHALGGGMLKLEPTEAENVVVPAPQVGAGALARLADELDALVRSGNEATARARADSAILQGELGLSTGDCDLLRLGADLLRGRRYSR